MEDSFSDFQAKKKINTGPKNLVKARVNKKLKKVRGQKDIRKVLKEKENELVSYSKNFDQVCKTSGLDVDSEQLQLAIALSKSLQDPPSSNFNSLQESVPVSSQERTAKIRNTLQQYGFKVSNTIIDNNKPKKRIKSNKQYKLLVISDAAKKQIISDKYSEVLVNNIHKTFNSKDIQCTNKSELYYKATYICYDLMKNNDIFYVGDLCLEVLHDISMLRDWSEIPGRPLSPVLKVNNYKFNSKYYNQDELDFILSGSIHTVQEIVKNNQKVNEIVTKMEKKNEEIFIKEEVNTNDKDNPNLQKNYMENEQIPILTNVRSFSPDIFDDDISILEDTNPIQIPEKTKNHIASKRSTVSSQDITKRKSIDCIEIIKVTNPFPEKTIYYADNPTIFMDLTECVNIAANKSTVLSQDTDMIKRKSNEYLEIIEDTNSIQVPHKTKNNTYNQTIFMDLTECVNIASNKSTVLSHDTDITKRKSNDYMETTDCVSTVQCCTINLTQAPNILNYDKKHTNNIEVNLETMDLTQSSYSDEESVKNVSVDNNCLDETIVINDQSNTSKRNRNLSSQKYDEQNHQENENCSPCYSFTDHVFEHSYIYDYNNEENLDSDSGKKNPNIDTDRQSSCKSDEENNSQEKTINENNCSNEVIPCQSGSESFHKIALSNCDVENLQNNCGNNMHNKNVIEGTNEDMNPNIIKNDLNINNNTEEKESEDVHEQDALNVDNNISPVHDYNDFVFEHEHIFTNEDQNSRDFDENLKSEGIKSMDNNEDSEDLILIENNVPNVDLTQSDSSSNEMEYDNVTPFTDLGKKDDVSIDYDDIIEVQNAFDAKANHVSLESNNSEVFNISDTEFNYSMHHSRLDDFDRHNNIDKEIETVGENISTSKLNRSLSDGNLNIESSRERKTQGLSTSSCVTTPTKVLNQDITKIMNETPKNTDYIIKTNDVTPMADYTSMTSPERNKELDKYGLKPFKRKRAIQLLTYIYNQTHPVVESCDVNPSPSKKPKYDKTPTKTNSPRKHSRSPQLEVKDKLYVVTKEVPDIKEIVCDPEEWIFQTREKAKIYSCRVPLHIAFHNYVSCRRSLRESILRYEPINIDVIHKELVSTGYRYNPKDLLKFMDKKCITVKTADNTRNKR